jgi:hypothetical protein
MSTKNPGQQLISIYLGTLEHIPPEWRAKLGIKRTDQQQPPDVEPAPLAGTLIGSQVVQTQTNERKKTEVEIEGDPNITLVQEEMLPNGQIATRTRRWRPEGSQIGDDLTDPTLQGTQHNLGIGWLDESVLDAPLPGPTIISTRLDPDGEEVTVAKTRKLISAITEGEFVVGGLWKKVYREGEKVNVATEVVETRPIAG